MDQPHPYFLSSPSSTGDVTACPRAASQLLRSCSTGEASVEAANGKAERAKQSLSWKPSAEPHAVGQAFLTACTALRVPFSHCHPRRADTW